MTDSTVVDLLDLGSMYEDVEADDLDWPSSGIGARVGQLEQCLTCNICKDFLRNAIALPCNHLYCKECILRNNDSVLRGTLTKRKCPTCNMPLQGTSNEMREIPILAECIDNFKASRTGLLDMINNFDTRVKEAAAKIAQEEIAKAQISSATATASQQGSAGKRKRGRKKKYDEEEHDTSMMNDYGSGNNDVTNLENKKSAESVSVTPITKRISVPMNTKGNIKQKVTLLKQQMEAICAKIPYKLNTSGSYEELASRFRDFTHRHNAQICENGETNKSVLSLEETVRQFNADETAKSNEQWKERSSKKVIDAIVKGQGGDEGFAALIAKERRKKAEREQKRKRDEEGTEESSINMELVPASIDTTDAPGPPATASAIKGVIIDNYSILWSAKNDRPFFYEGTGKVGTFDIPEELKDMFADIHNERDFSVLLAGHRKQQQRDSVSQPEASQKEQTNVDYDASATDESEDEDWMKEKAPNKDDTKLEDEDKEENAEKEEDDENTETPLLTANSKGTDAIQERESSKATSPLMMDLTQDSVEENKENSQLAHLQCIICTFNNVEGWDKCEMCGTVNKHKRQRNSRNNKSHNINNFLSSKPVVPGSIRPKATRR